MSRKDRYEAVGAVLCAIHPTHAWHMPEEGCHLCAMAKRTPEEVAQDQVEWDAWWAKVKANAKPMSSEESERTRAFADERKSEGPGLSSGVMGALIARMRDTVTRYEKDTTEIRERAKAAWDADDDLSEMLTAAAQAIDDLRRKRHWYRKMAEAWEEFADALHKDDTPRLKAAGEAVAVARKALIALGVKAPTIADKTRASTEPN